MNIEVNNLYKTFDNFELSDISLKVPRGKIVGIIGENGAGKTTLIKCILNIMNYDRGEVILFKQSYNDYLKDKIGVVLDDSFINEKYCSNDINLMMIHIHKKWDQDLFYSFLKMYKINPKMEIKKMSAGTKRKLQIAVSLAFHPKLLILDEPTSGLDPIIRSEILDMFQDFVSNGENSILLSTHITTDLEHIADYVLFISNGKIVFEDKLKTIKQKYTVVTIDKDKFKNFKYEIIRYKENKNDYQVLTYRNKEYKDNETSLEEIMLLYIRGELC